ncbi:MAG TPA: hypothetical protein VM942_00720 [Acidimicrobiales bacterium]|nr:hypothetical protein [Acidimicrobiales bacterium]
MAWALVLAATAGCGGSPPSAGDGAPTTTIAAAPGASAFGPPVLLGQIADPGVTESSGLAASRRHPGRLWTHNDSDQPPIVFCVEPDGGSCGGWNVAGADNIDWEDIAAGPGPRPGEHYLYIGDIGDNTLSRPDVVVYRVLEPTVDAPQERVTAPATALRFRYDDGAHDAESLMVHPGTGDVYVVVKAPGDVGVYKGAPEGGVLRRVATLGLGWFGLATGADISPDGRRVALCTPFEGFELTLDPADSSDFDSIWAQPTVAVALPGRTQGESIAYRLDGDALLATSEGEAAPLLEAPRL